MTSLIACVILLTPTIASIQPTRHTHPLLEAHVDLQAQCATTTPCPIHPCPTCALSHASWQTLLPASYIRHQCHLPSLTGHASTTKAGLLQPSFNPFHYDLSLIVHSFCICKKVISIYGYTCVHLGQNMSQVWCPRDGHICSVDNHEKLYMV